MDFKVLKKLIGMVEKSAIDELEVEHKDFKVRIKKSSTSTIQPAQLITPQAAAPQVIETNVPAEQQAAQVDEGLEEIASPMVGTFYTAANPGDSPFVKEGDNVKKGDILCIIEAMKLMNEIESSHTGTIMSIAVDNAQPVEYGERLFLIRPKQ